MKSSILAALAILIAIITATGWQRCYSSEIQGAAGLETNFGKAEDILFKLLLPNSMARTEPRSKEDEKALLGDFKIVAAMFTENPELSVPFLAEKLKPSSSDDDAAICALQILYEIDTPNSRKAIQDAQKHPVETVSRLAREMITERVDALWGFSSSEKK